MLAFAARSTQLALVIAALVVAGPVAAATYTFDQDRTQVRFSFAFGFGTGGGKFTRVGGTVAYDEAAPQATKVDAVVDTQSLTSEDSLVEDQMRGPSFFDVEAAPKMTFVSRSVRPISPGVVEITADLTIKGITKPVLLRSSIKPHAGEKGAQKFVAQMRMQRSQFGMTGFALLVGDEVDIVIDGSLLPAR